MFKRYVMVFWVGLALLTLTQPLLAQEEEGVADTYAYGQITAITGNEIVINELILDTDEFKDVSYQITDNTILENILSLDELAVGDDVEILFEDTDGKKIVVAIYKFVYEEEYAE